MFIGEIFNLDFYYGEVVKLIKVKGNDIMDKNCSQNIIIKTSIGAND